MLFRCETLVGRSYLQCDFLLIVETFSQFVFGHRQPLFQDGHSLQPASKDIGVIALHTWSHITVTV